MLLTLLCKFSHTRCGSFETCFLEIYSSFSANFFRNGLLYLVLWNVQINFFLVMVVMVTKKMVLLWFPWQWLWRKKFLHLFQTANVGKYSLRVSAQSNDSDPLLRPWTPVTDLQQRESKSKFYDSVLYRWLW